MSEDSDVLVGVKDACCCCLRCPEHLSDMKTGEPSLKEMITSCFRYKILQSNASPFMVCGDCKSRLAQSWNFFCTVKVTQALLKKLSRDGSFVTDSEDIKAGIDPSNSTSENHDNGFLNVSEAPRTHNNIPVCDIKKECHAANEEFEPSFCDSPFDDDDFREDSKPSKPSQHSKKDLDLNIPVEVEITPGCDAALPNTSSDKKKCSNSARKSRFKKSKNLRDLSNQKAAVQCDICKAVVQKGSLKRHLQTHYYNVDSKPSDIADETSPDARQSHFLSPDDLKCTICGETFEKRFGLVRHMSEHFPNYRCDTCGKCFTNKSSFSNHQRRHEAATADETAAGDVTNERSDSRRFKCHKCGKGFNYESSLNSHYLLHKTTDLTCDICKKVMMSERAFRKHTERCRTSNRVMKHFQFKRLKTALYNFDGDGKSEIPDSNSLTGTRYILDSSDLTCKVCNETFQWPRLLQRHLAVHFPNYVCQTCGKCFVFKNSFQVHLRSHENKQYTCDVCKRSFGWAENLKAHLKTHFGGAATPVNYKCKYPQCPETFTTRYSKMKHISEVHDDNSAVYTCKLCPKTFYVSSGLLRHVRKDHLFEKKHLCPVCGDAFFEKSILKSHMVRHDGEKCFECGVCKKSYARKKTLTEHMKIHNGDKRFQCDVCERWFTQKCTLVGHMKVHGKYPPAYKQN